MTNEPSRRPDGDLCDLVQRGYRFAFSLTHDPARADDLLQDAWLSVLKATGPWTIEYLFKTIRCRFIDRCRRGALAAFEPLDIDSSDGAFEVAAKPIESLGEPDRNFECAGLSAALDRLRPEERAALYLSAVEDFTAQQIADFFGWPRGTVLSLIHRARAKMQSWIADRGGLPS